MSTTDDIELAQLPAEPPDDSGSPSSGSLYEDLVAYTQILIGSAYLTTFIQAMMPGTLWVANYGGFTVSDSYTRYTNANIYHAAAARSTVPDLQDFLETKQQQAQAIYEAVLKFWRLKDITSVNPYPPALELAAFKGSVAESQDPIYTVVTMLARPHLWHELAVRMSRNVTAHNPYSSWIRDNFHSNEWNEMRLLLDAYVKLHPNEVDPAHAKSLFWASMFKECKILDAVVPRQA